MLPLLVPGGSDTLGTDPWLKSAKIVGVLVAVIVGGHFLLRHALRIVAATKTLDKPAFLAMVGVIVYQNWKLAGVSAIVIPLSTMTMVRVGQRLRKLATTGQEKMGDLSSALQETLVELSSFQCGFCAPGIVLATQELLDHVDHPTRRQVQEAISGNLCRCTGYEPIIDAVLAAAAHGGD